MNGENNYRVPWFWTQIDTAQQQKFFIKNLSMKYNKHGRYGDCGYLAAKIVSHLKRWCQNQRARHGSAGIFGLAAFWASSKPWSFFFVYGLGFESFLTMIQIKERVHQPVALSSETLPNLLHHLLGSHGAFSTIFLLGLHQTGILIGSMPSSRPGIL
jgi:hypothetical protein